MLGVTKQDLVRTNLSKFITNESQDNWYLHRRAAFLEEAAQVCEIGIRRHDDAVLSIRAESIGFGSGKDRQVRMALVDITEQKRVLALEQAARRELESGDKIQRQVSSNGLARTENSRLLRYWAGSSYCGIEH